MCGDKMIIDLTRLINNFSEEIKIKEIIKFNDDYLKNTEIRSLDNVEIDGYICCTSEQLYNFNATVKGEMILPCSITLEDVKYPFTLKIDEILSENEEDDEKYIKIFNNTIDIMPIIWQNIVMEIPLKVISPKVEKIKMEGDGWRLITDEERNREINSGLDE